jgi:microcystin degradation protein MlrC
MHIAIGGFQHETNTFAPHPATLADFETADGWPGLVRGAPLFEVVHGRRAPRGCRRRAAAPSATARGARSTLNEQLLAHEDAFALRVHTVDTALARVQQLGSTPGSPIILADTQDNPGAGGTCDTTSLLKALLAQRVPQVLAGLLFDPRAAARAHAAGVGARIELSLGAQSDTAGTAGEAPLHERFEVLALGDGRFTAISQAAARDASGRTQGMTARHDQSFTLLSAENKSIPADSPLECAGISSSA